MAVVFVCPGQGAEEPGMGLALAARSPRARRLLELASEATGVDVARALERGGRALERTEVLQPAMVAVSLGAAHDLAERGVVPAFVIGHSLGELTAAAIAAELPDEVAIALATERGRWMAEAARGAAGGLCAIRDGTPGGLEEAVGVALERGCVLAARNAPDERVVAGSPSALDATLAVLGARASRLRALGPWHSPAMATCVEPMRARALEALTGRTLRARLVSAVGPVTPDDGAAVAELLGRGLVEPVCFERAVGMLVEEGATRAHVLSPSRALSSLVRRASRGAISVT